MKFEDIEIGMKVRVTPKLFEWRDPADYAYLDKEYNGRILTVSRLHPEQGAVTLINEQGFQAYWAYPEELSDPYPKPTRLISKDRDYAA
jgi:hypothetical protein